MTLAAGTKLGPYDILALIGAGGMGEVYRARDTKLERDVALKILPETVAQDPERLARFEREAKVLASLNHPNIAQIYGVEDRAIVMELVEGEPLSGPLPLDTVLDYVRQIASALEAAHDKGIVHRDLKPGNIMVTPQGVVKVLDFGLAAVAQSSAPGQANVTQSPTMTLAATQMGMLLGTAAYMSPEQARGKPVDKRADIWAFGAVLYEMVTGRPLFQGEDVSHTLASVIMKEPDLEAVPPKIRRVLKRCLEKDPKKRLRDISGVELLLEEAPATTVAPVTAPSRSRFGNIAWVAVGLMTAVAAALAFVHFREKPPVAEPIRFQVLPPDKAQLVNSPPVVSPDGRRLAFVANERGENRLWVRSLDTLDARPIAGTEGASQNTFFWSPDSRFLGFAQGDKLRKVDVSGGPPQTVCDLPAPYRGGGWGPGGVIVFSAAATGLLRASEAGGAASPLTRLDAARGETLHATPSFLPDGRHFVYTRQGASEIRGIYIGSLDMKPEQQSEKRLLAATGIAVYAPSSNRRTGYLLFLRDGSLMAQPFDGSRMELSGDAFPIAETVGNNFHNSWFSASATGVLAYRTGLGEGAASPLTWFDRSGKNLGIAGEQGQYAEVTLSPDGTRAAVMKADSSNVDIWLHEFARATTTRFTFDPAIDRFPVWSPDGKRIAFSSQREGSLNLYTKPSNGAGNEEILFRSKDNKAVQDWSRDGRFLIYTLAVGGHSDLWVLPLEGDKKSVAYVKSAFLATGGRFSPDTRFVAYSSNASGKQEIYVQTFPEPSGGQWMVSKGGGAHPRWRRDGKELFYISADSQLMAVEVSLSPTFKAGIPKALFRAPMLGGAVNPALTRYDVAADGQRFLISAVGAEADSAAKASPITVVLNWQAGLKK